jgi:hypothetical protein
MARRDEAPKKGLKSLQKSELCGSMKLMVPFTGIKRARPALRFARQGGLWKAKEAWDRFETPGTQPETRAGIFLFSLPVTH